MKFSTSIRHFQDTVNKVTQAIPAKALDPRYENLHLSLDNGSLTLFATDGDMSITAITAVESSENGHVGMKARTILDFLRSMYDTSVTFAIERQQLSDQGIMDISTDKGLYKIPCTLESKQEKKDKSFSLELTLPVKDLSDIIQKTIFACSVDGMRPAMMGVLFEIENNSITAVSTDGHRLVRCRKPCQSEVAEKQKLVIPARVLSILQKLMDDEQVTVSIDTTNNSVRFTSGNIVLDAALIVEQYPNYEAVIPLENDKNVRVERSLLYDSVKRVGRFSSIGDIRFSIASNSIDLMAENTNEGESAREGLPCTYEGDDITIGFNSKFIEAALAHIESDAVTMELSTPTTAVILKPADEKEERDLIILVMPVRINN
ncbi:DNA polymerase III subunit beta [Prosthecochloris sp. N3]|uniref:Beta sliding clamp n=1 Tax=Prosthecochloris ethylica TaxID=2743976 RepID=A0ABR9XRA4_9CHLB|nr:MULTISPECIES: DNA polymerase III subunit beta [Prosthecochloris]MBF0586024.1 DNA polymerase III subunit beta [Prosthecochloris ethylica]MBF0636576.1 DNA polymerase III subunit beta [Prosthecochloris ethylica]NUK47208.1 DNA polymerase III subunit beta [Prosthecochloris ethylica]RNA65738.1 DNA polymerase III subunit beta [Prosthecochloris sp. ZM_2]